MTRLRALFHFNVGELLVRREELGRSYLVADDPPVRLGLPGADPPFVLAVDRHGDHESPFSGSSRGATGDPNELIGVRVIQLNVELSAELNAADFPPGESSTWPSDAALEVFDRAFAAARSAYLRFRAWARVVGEHHWLAMSHEEPEFAGHQVLEDLEAKVRIPVGYPPLRSVVVGYSADKLAAFPTVESIIKAMGAADLPALADTLLEDARAIYWPRIHTGQDHQRAVLLAAIASEVRVKERLLELSSPELRPLVEVIVRNPRDVTQSVPQLLNKPAKVVTGRSLLEEDRPLWEGVERLFKTRNSVAHRGLMPSEEQGEASVKTATQLFAWLNEL